MKQYLAALPLAVLAFAVPAAASAATLTVSPAKDCYRSGEDFTMGGTGFTANGPVNVAANGATLTGSPLGADGAGSIGAKLKLGQDAGQQVKTLVATDATNPALTASAEVLVSAVAVRISPQDGVAGRRLSISARGFTTGKRLYAHITRRGKLKGDYAITRLNGPCARGAVRALDFRLLSNKRSKGKRKQPPVRRPLFPSNTPSGTYKVQFDTKRKRSSATEVKSVYTVTIFPMARGGRASAAAVSAARGVWTPGS